MTRHLLKLVWHRKGANALIVFEIFLSFLVVFAVTAMGAYAWRNVRLPLGFRVDDVWIVSIQFEAGQQEKPEDVGRVQQDVLLEIRGLEPVESAAFLMMRPFSGGRWRETINGHTFEVETMTPEADDVLDLDLVAGRWFDASDFALKPDSVVVNRRLARELFGDEDPIGKVFHDNDEKDNPGWKVVGVVSDFRRHGDLSAPRNVVLGPIFLERPQHVLRVLAVRVQPGTPASFEEPLVRRLEAVAPRWSFRIDTMRDLRREHIRTVLIPLVVAGTVGGFLLVMVALGLVGVLWQNVTQRTREIGLRRAKGASVADVHRQILFEVLLMTSFGVVLAGVVLLHLPLIEVFGKVDFGVYAAAFGAAVVLIYGLTAASGLYPAWLAARVRPAEALHYD